MTKRILLYAAALALGAAALQWLEFQRFARLQPEALAVGLIAAAFLGLGLYLGARLFGPAPAAAPGNPAAQAELGISGRELEVLQELAAGRSNKEIAQRLNISPNTIKTHTARLYEKLGAKRRTEAIARARALKILP